MLSEEEFKAIISKLIQDVKIELASPIQRIFAEEDIQRSILDGDLLALEDNFYRGLRRWIPSRERLAAIVAAGIFEEVAIRQYELLKNKFELGG